MTPTRTSFACRFNVVREQTRWCVSSRAALSDQNGMHDIRVSPTNDLSRHYADRSSARRTPVSRLVTRRMSGTRKNNHHRADRRSRIRKEKQKRLLEAKHSGRIPDANDFHHRHTITVRQVCGREHLDSPTATRRRSRGERNRTDAVTTGTKI